MSLLDKWTTILKVRRANSAAKAKQVEKAQKQLAWKQELVRRAEKKVHDLQAETGPRAAIHYARKFIGTTESPAGSNRGPQIDIWERDVDMIAQPWCGAFVHAALKHAGVQGLSSRMRFTPFIVADGQAGVNGLEKEVAWEDRKPGDLLLFNFPGGNSVDHVGIYVSDRADGLVNTIEGNTSSGTSGSQSNGGGVFARQRARSLVAHVIRPRYRA